MVLKLDDWEEMFNVSDRLPAHLEHYLGNGNALVGPLNHHFSFVQALATSGLLYRVT